MTVLAHDWYPAEVPANVMLGERSWVHSSFAFIHHRSERDPSVRIGPDSGAYVGTYFDLGPQGEVEIGRYCAVVGTTFASNDRIVIGDYTLIAYGVVIAGSAFAIPAGARVAMGEDSRPGAQRDVTIGSDVWIGARAVVLGGSNVGNGAIIGAAAVVDGEVPEYAVAAGNPARIVGWARPATEPGSKDPSNA
jgi:acetyltransferase-like isoleucine patch superfamily enzyme